MLKITFYTAGFLEEMAVIVANDEMLIVNKYALGHQVPVVKRASDIVVGTIVMTTSHQSGKTGWSEVTSITGVEG